MGLKVGTVELVKYDSHWKKEYEKEALKLKKIFGEIAISIEHIGSTSIEGLSAKPIIDIAVAVKYLSDFNKVKNYFIKGKNYSIKEDSVADEILIRKGSEDNGTHFIHVMEYESDRYKESILFKKYLIKHPEAKQEYETLKRKLQEQYYDDRKMYTASKNDFIKTILEKAKIENFED